MNKNVLMQDLTPCVAHLRLRDWYVQAGASGMNATDTLNRGAVMLGGSQGDALVGGKGNDTLLGGAGDDVIYAGDGGSASQYTYVSGGGGDDMLVGGEGYAYLQGGSGGAWNHCMRWRSRAANDTEGRMAA